MKTFRLFCNPNAKSQGVKLRLQLALARSGFVPADNDEVADFCIAIGGDGAFLRMVRDCNFVDTKYVGINTGTLGFLQEINENELYGFVAALRDGKYDQQSISYINCEILSDGVWHSVKSLNDIVIRDADLQTLKLEIRIDGALLENYVGDGVLICSSLGSTAHNLNYGGAFVPFEADTLQLTHIAPVNSIAYRSLSNSAITGGSSAIDIIAEKPDGNIVLSIDGNNKAVQNFERLRVSLCGDRITYIKIGSISFWQKINTKFIGR